MSNNIKLVLKYKHKTYTSVHIENIYFSLQLKNTSKYYQLNYHIHISTAIDSSSSMTS